MGNILNLALDLLIIALLIAVIVQSVRLMGRLAALRESRKEMDATIRQFFEASAKAELAIRNFQKSAGETTRKLDGDTTKAALLIDELKLMIDSGNGLAERLESVVDRGKVLTPRPVTGDPQILPEPQAVKEPAPAPAGRAGLAEPLGMDAAVPARAGADAAQVETDDQDDEDKGAAAGGNRAAAGEGRSRAEQELLKALQNMR